VGPNKESLLFRKSSMISSYNMASFFIFHPNTNLQNRETVPVTRKLSQENTSILVSGKRRIQARCENVVKMVMKFIRKDI
jgi:hypothetical protein